MLNVLWILLGIFLIFLSSLILALFPSSEVSDECKGNPRYKKGAKEHKKVPYKIEFLFNGGCPLYSVHYKCKYCGQEYTPILYRQEDLKGERLYKYSKDLGICNREVYL